MRSVDMRYFLEMMPHATVRDFICWCRFVKILGSHKGYPYGHLDKSKGAKCG
jgi:hypothetical protein